MKTKLTKILCSLPTAVLPLSLSSCFNVGELEDKYNDFAEKNQSDFFNNLTYQYHDYYFGNDLYCNSEAEAILMWTYGPGFTEWGTLLHQGKEAEMETLPDIKASIGIPSKFAPRDYGAHIDRDNLSFRIKDYKMLDKALSHSTAGENIVVYHGYEYNEYEMMKSINDALGLTATNKDILTLDENETESLDLSPLKNQTLTDLCWCATTMEESFALDWGEGNTETETGETLYNVPIYKMNLDSNVNCAYVSYSRKKWFDGIYLAWPHEYQVLTQRNLHFKITDVTKIKRSKNPGYFIYITCDVTKN